MFMANPAGAVTAVCLTLCGAPFAATDRSYRVNSNRLTSAPGSRLELVWRSP